MKYFYKIFLKILKKYKFRNNQLAITSTVNIKARLTSVIAGEYSRFAEHADVRNSQVGDYSTIGRYAKIVNTEIGKFCAVSWDCTINAVSHPYSHLSIHAFPYVPHAGGFVSKRVQKVEKVIIGNDVWVGANSVIMPGLRIGDGAVIGANAVVTKDVPPYAIVVGVPAKILKYRFSDEIIESLLKVRWWDLDRKILEQHIGLFQKPLTLEMLAELKKWR